MTPSVRRLRRFGTACFFVFVACACATAASGLWLILGRVWEEEPNGFVIVLFLCAFLLTVITGLLVSGANSMMGILTASDAD